MIKHTKSVKIIGRQLGRPRVGKGRVKVSRGIQSDWIDLVLYKLLNPCVTSVIEEGLQPV